MTSRLHRSLVRIAGASLIVAGLCLGTAQAAVAAPAPGATPLAAEPTAQASAPSADLTVSITGTTLAAGTTAKDVNITIANRGTATATDVNVVFEYIMSLQSARVWLDLPLTEACHMDPGGAECPVMDIGAGQALDIVARLVRVPGSEPGDVGTFTIGVGYTGPGGVFGGTSATARVIVAGGGPDLYAYAPDMPFDPATNKTSTVAPGRTAKLRYAVGNFGDAPVAGIRLVITLPRQVTFAESGANCVYDEAGSRATCTYRDLPIVPADDDKSDKDRVYSMVSFHNVVRVAAGAPAPSRLTGGEVSVEPLPASAPANARTTRPAASVLPGNAVGGSARRLPADRNATAAPDAPASTVGDVDSSDNTDEFSVYVARAAAAPPHQSGGLPITGSEPARTALVGLSALLLGALLLLVSRGREARTGAGVVVAGPARGNRLDRRGPVR